MYSAAQKYEFKCTTDDLILFMIDDCKDDVNDVKKFLAYLNFAIKNYTIELQKECQKIVEYYTDVILTSESFMHAHPRVINWIYSLNDLNINEWDLIKIVEKYKAFHACTDIQQAINNIRFLSLTPEIVDHTYILLSEEKNYVKDVIEGKSSEKSIPIYMSRHRIGRCFKGIKIICDDTELKDLIDRNEIKLGIIEGKRFFVTKEGLIKASVEEDGKVVRHDEVMWTPLKEIPVNPNKSKKTCTGLQQTVLFYKENKKIMINKRDEASKNHKEALNLMENLSISTMRQ